MNVFLLMEALRVQFKAEFTHLPLVTRKRTSNEHACTMPKIYVGNLPAKTASDTWDAPLVLIQAMGGHESPDGFARAVIALRVCVWNDEPEGAENDLHNVLACIRHALLPFRNTALEGRYILEADESGALAPWTRPDEQAANFAEAYVLTNWKMQGLG